MRTLFKALTALALTLFIAACSGGGTPEKTAEQFIRDAYNGNGDAVVAMLYIPADAKPGEKEMVEGKMRSSAAEVKAKAETRDVPAKTRRCRACAPHERQKSRLISPPPTEQ